MYQAPFEYEGELIDPSRHPLETGLPPAWASGWGQDEFGVFAELKISDVTQKLRWIPPGKFKMGSPSDEPGRYDDEGPQHDVTISSGFWLFDTPVTQDLWTAVMEKNPSEFEGGKRPVENVNWHDAKKFCKRLSGLVPSLKLRLPSEAEWEYACRAGVPVSTYAGQLSMSDEKADHQFLNRIAWYVENSDTQTHPVAQKEPNGFGLYDMLGNVDEWCADEWHESFAGAPSDGSVWERHISEQERGARAFGVVRGGSWDGDARGVRSAFRFRVVPSNRIYLLGFRCAGGQVELKKAVRSTEPASEIPEA